MYWDCLLDISLLEISAIYFLRIFLISKYVLYLYNIREYR